MPKHTQRNIAFVIFGVIIVGSMIFFLTLPVGEINVNLAPPLILTDTGFVAISLPIGETVVEATGINCKVKQTTLVYGINNKQLDSLDSSGIQGSPFIRLGFIQGTDIEVVAYNANPKIFCFEGSGLPLEVAIRDMQLTVRANFLTVSNTILETQQVFGSRLLSFGQGQGEQTLVSFPVQVSELESQLPDQNFPLSLTFEITGKINVYYRDFPSLVYSIPIFRADLETFHTIDIRKEPEVFIGIVTITCPSGQEDVDPSPDSILCKPIDTDKDGYPDITDSCPFEAEIFNGFEDLDGCPDTAPTLITCSDGTMVTSTSLCPAPVVTCESQDDRNCTRSLCEADGGVFIEERNILNQITNTYCQLSEVKPKCEPDEKLELTTGNIFICVKDPDLQDDDGDGILNGIDACPKVFGIPEFQGCPEPPPITGLNLEDEVIKGDIVTLTTVSFTDNTIETAVASARGGTAIQLENLVQQISNLVPAELIGTITEGEGKSIDLIAIEIFYFNNESPPNAFVVESKDISLILTVEESSVSSASSNPLTLFGGIGTGALGGLSGEVGLLGSGISLGSVAISAENIVDLGEQAGITSGQRKDANLIFSISGFVNFKDEDETKRFLLTNTLITFRNVDIDNVAPPEAEPKCLDTQIEIIDPRTGRVIGCETPPPDAPKCFSSERPQGYACTPQDILTFCNGDPANCREKDLDNDGVPDYRDDCRDTSKPNFKEDGSTANGSDPDDGCSAIKKGVGCNPLIQNCTPEEPPVPPVPPFCSEENPDACIFPPEQITLLLIVIAVILIVIGIAVAISRRRAKVFG